MTDQISVTVKKIAYRQSNAGHSVTFLLPPLGEMDATALAAADMGSTFKMVLIYVDENDQPTSSSEAKETEPESVSNPPVRARKSWDELPITSKIAIRCNEVTFQTFLKERFADNWQIMNDGDAPQRAAELVRWQCDVQSRRDIRQGTESFMKWMTLEHQYQTWLRT